VLTRLLNVPVRLVAADEAYGGDYRFQRAVEQSEVGNVLAVPWRRRVRRVTSPGDHDPGMGAQSGHNQ